MLEYKAVIPGGEVTASPVLCSDGYVVVASMRGFLTKVGRVDRPLGLHDLTLVDSSLLAAR